MGNRAPELLEWPGRGNPHFSTRMGYSLPDQDLAPFYDRNNDGIYDPLQGDYPVFKAGVAAAIAEEVLWTVFHSRDNGGFNQGDAMQLEVQQTVYALDCGTNDLLNLSLFVNHKLINRGSKVLQNVHYANWNDFDLGCFVDDYIGSIPNKNTIYAYNADMNDEVVCNLNGAVGYGTNPPVQAVTFLNETLKTATYNVNGTSDPRGEPSTMLEYLNIFTGLFPNGTPITAGGDGYNPNSTNPAVQFVFPDNPNNMTGWSMASENLVGLDQRTLGIVERPTLGIGMTWEIDLMYSFHRGTGPHSLWSNVNLMYQQLDVLQQYYDNGLENVTCPAVTYCSANCVYPGDANNNGIANDFDVLEMGLHYGQTALPRTQTGDRWYPYNPPTPNNNAYVDANGVGTVDNLDLDANTQNWNLTHSLYTGAVEGSNAVGTELHFERIILAPLFTADTVVPLGGLIQLQAHLSDTSNPLTIQGVR